MSMLRVCPAHPQSLLDYVCLDRFCRNRGVLCDRCRHTHHSSHKVVPLNLFLKTLKSKVDCLYNNSQSTAKQRYYREMLTEQLQELNNNLTAMISHMEQVIGSYLCYEEDPEQEFSQRSDGDPRKIFEKLWRIQNDAESLQRGFNEAINLYFMGNEELHQRSNWAVSQQLFRQEKHYEVVTQTLQSLSQLMEDLMQKLLKVQDISPPAPTLPSDEEYWSKQLRMSPLLQLTGGTIQRLQGNDGKCAIAVFHRMFQSDYRQELSFRIQSITAPLVLGMCIYYQVLESQFMVELRQKYKSFFAISNRGAVFSHADSICPPSCQPLQNGDVVTISHFKNILTFVIRDTHLHEKDRLEIDISTSPELNCRPCIGITAPGDSIEIIRDFGNGLHTTTL